VAAHEHLEGPDVAALEPEHEPLVALVGRHASFGPRIENARGAKRI
jgi:hypothetical protein